MEKDWACYTCEELKNIDEMSSTKTSSTKNGYCKDCLSGRNREYLRKKRCAETLQRKQEIIKLKQENAKLINELEVYRIKNKDKKLKTMQDNKFLEHLIRENQALRVGDHSETIKALKYEIRSLKNDLKMHEEINKGTPIFKTFYTSRAMPIGARVFNISEIKAKGYSKPIYVKFQ